MGPSKELTALLFELERAASPLERLQIIARAWRSVRALDGLERRDLARQVGLDGAEELIDRLARKGGLAPATLLEALRRARRADPAQLRTILTGLRTPAGREQAAFEGFQLAQNIFAPEANESGSADDSPSPPEPLLRPGADEPQVPSEETPGDAPITGTPAIVEAAAAPAPPPATIPPKPHPPVPRPPEARPRPVVTLAARVPRPAPPPTPRPAPSGPRVPPASVPISTPPVRQAAEAAPPQATRDSPLRALRRLEARLEAPKSLEVAELDALVLGLPDGWVRRRAVLALLRHGLPPRIPDALRLVEALGLQRDRRWALSALLEDRTLAPEELGQAMSLITSEPARRRLRRLAACGRSEESRVESEEPERRS